MFDFSFILLLGLVSTGSRWRAGIGYLPPGHSAAGKTGKTGILGADGEPDKDPTGRQLTTEEKADIAKKDQEMRDKEMGIERNPEPTKGDVLELTDYRRKGANAYLVPVTVDKGTIVRGKFEGGDSDDYARAGAGKANTRTINLGNKPDGWYEYQEGEYGSNRVYRGYIEVKGGKIVDQIAPERLTKGGAKEAFLAKVAPVKAMPELSGSAKQQSWAESIREKAIRVGKITEEQAAKQTDSRWWIDNRTKF